MTLSKTEPCEYFSTVQLLESELVRFRMRPSKSQLDVVVIYVAETLGGYFGYIQAGGVPTDYKLESIDFRLLRFQGVKSIRTRLGLNVPCERAPKGNTDRQWDDHEKTVLLMKRRLITNVDCKKRPNGFECIMYFDSFGEHTWEFHQLYVDRRVTKVKSRNNRYEYRDSSTGVVVDPSDPFADQMNSQLIAPDCSGLCDGHRERPGKGNEQTKSRRTNR